MKKKTSILLSALLAASLCLQACGSAPATTEPTIAPTATLTPTEAPVATATPEPAEEAVATATPEPTATPVPTATPAPTKAPDNTSAAGTALDLQEPPYGDRVPAHRMQTVPLHIREARLISVPSLFHAQSKQAKVLPLLQSLSLTLRMISVYDSILQMMC